MNKMEQVTIDPAKALENAQQARYEIRMRIADGDLTLTPDDLEAAERAVRFAQVRVDHAAEADQRRREEARSARVAEIRASLPAIFDTTQLDAAHQVLVEALDTYCTEVKLIQEGVSEVYNELIRGSIGLGRCHH